MMTGFYAGLAAAALAETEARLQQQEAARQAAAQQALAEHQRQIFELRQGDVIDVEAREVPEPPALPAPATE